MLINLKNGDDVMALLVHEDAKINLSSLAPSHAFLFLFFVTKEEGNWRNKRKKKEATKKKENLPCKVVRSTTDV